MRIAKLYFEAALRIVSVGLLLEDFSFGSRITSPNLSHLLKTPHKNALAWCWDRWRHRRPEGG